MQLHLQRTVQYGVLRTYHLGSPDPSSPSLHFCTSWMWFVLPTLIRFSYQVLFDCQPDLVSHGPTSRTDIRII